MPVYGAGNTAASSYGIRPEHLQLAAEGVPSEVVVVEPTGSETMIVGRLGQQMVTAVFKDRVSAAPGTILTVSFDPALAHLFDTNGRRIS